MTPEPLSAAIRKAITDAYYDARNAGGTMETAADDATTAVLATLAAREPAGAGLREALLLEFDGSVCPACHHRSHDPGSCHACPRCELHTDEAFAFVLRYEPELLVASPAEPGLDVTMNDSRVVTGGLPDPAARSGLDVEREARVLLTLALDHDDYVLIHRDNWSRFRAALAAPPAEPGLGRLRRIEAAAFSLVSTFSVLPVPILTEHDHAALRALRAALSVPKP